LTLISATHAKFGASLTALSPPLALHPRAHFLDRIFTLFPMVRGLFLAEVGRALVFRVCCLFCTVFPSFPPRGPRSLAHCDCSVLSRFRPWPQTREVGGSLPCC
jgi:hypothetical protein